MNSNTITKKGVCQLESYSYYPVDHQMIPTTNITVSKALFNLYNEYPELIKLFKTMEENDRNENYNQKWKITSYDNIIHCHEIHHDTSLEIILDRTFNYNNFELKRGSISFSFKGEIFLP